MSAIIDIHAREILDSRGTPTVEAEVVLQSGAFGRAVRRGSDRYKAVARYSSAENHGSFAGAGAGRSQRHHRRTAPVCGAGRAPLRNGAGGFGGVLLHAAHLGGHTERDLWIRNR